MNISGINQSFSTSPAQNMAGYSTSANSTNSAELSSRINQIRQNIPQNSFSIADDNGIDVNFVNQWVVNKGSAPTSTDMAWLLLVQTFGEEEAAKLQKNSIEDKNGYRVESFIGPDGESYQLHIKAGDNGNLKESFLLNLTENTKKVMTYDTAYGNQGAGLGQEYTDGDGVRRAEWSSAGETKYAVIDTQTGSINISDQKPEVFEIDVGFVNEWAEDLGRDVKSEDLGYLLLLDILESEEDVRNLQTIVEYEGDQKITKFFAASGERYELRTNEKMPNTGIAAATLTNLENGSKATLTFDNNQELGAGYGTEYDFKGNKFTTWASQGETLFNAPDLDINARQLFQAENGNCVTLAVLSMLSHDDQFRDNVLEKNIVREGNGEYKVYLPGHSPDILPLQIRPDQLGDAFGTDEKGFFVKINGEDLSQNNSLVSKRSDQDLLLLATAAEKYANNYGLADRFFGLQSSTKNGLFLEGKMNIMSLFSGNQTGFVLDTKSAAEFLDQQESAVISFHSNINTEKLGDEYGQVLVPNHAYALMPKDDGTFNLINPWNNNAPMNLSKERLMSLLTEDNFSLAYRV